MTEREPTGDPSEVDVERRLDEIAEQFLDRLQAGETPDKATFLAAHPEIAALLEEHLTLVENLHQARLYPEVEGDDPPDSVSEAGRPPGRPGDPATSRPEDLPSRVGPYKIIRTLGVGGMGEVYLAEQAEPVRRQVAIKLIKLGMDTKEVVARFDTEQQALALMNHPHIARVLEAGATENGRPYFVMEHVAGESITDFCDSHRLTTTRRLELFSHICDAVQHAHQKGVIHRDLKPSNILVMQPNGQPVPKIIDFGVAKATNQRLTERTVFTEQGRVIGTPEYMSPEQAQANSLDVDTRTDIYSLGLILYELLVGALPFDKEGFRNLAYEEIRRKIREEEAPKPSTRVSSLGGDSRELAHRRRTDPASLTRTLRGDLDWIVLKAIEKDRARRYASASELEADIRRHLADEPVLASPPSKTYRLRKFVRKHRTPVTVVAVVALVLVAGVVVSTTAMMRARDALAQKEEQRKKAQTQEEAALAAKEEVQKERDAAQEAREEALAAKGEAETEAKKATAIKDFLADMLSSARPGRQGRDIKVAEILDQVERKIEGSFPDEPEVAATLHETVGYTYHALGFPESAMAHLDKALRIRRRVLGENDPETLTVMRGLSILLQGQGNFAKAEVVGRQALEGLERVLGPEDPETLVAMMLLARILKDLGEYPEAESLCRVALDLQQRILGSDHPETIASLSTLATLRERQGHLLEAIELERQAIRASLKTNGGEHPFTLTAMTNLGWMLEGAGEMTEAERIRRRVLQIQRQVLGEDHPETLNSMQHLASFLRKQGRLSESERLYRLTLEKAERLLGPDHPLVEVTTYHLGIVLYSQGRLDEAKPLLLQALQTLRRERGDDHRETITVMNGLACLLADEGSYEEAESVFGEILERGREVLGESHPLMLRARLNLASCMLDLKRLDEAETLYREAATGYADLLGPSHIDTLGSMDGLAAVLRSREKLAESEEIGRKILQLLEDCPQKDGWEAAVLKRGYALTLFKLGRYQDAEPVALEVYDRLKADLGLEHEETETSLDLICALYKKWGKQDVLDEYRAILGTVRNPPSED